MRSVRIPSLARRPPWIAWLGDDQAEELAFARAEAATIVEVRTGADAAAACSHPTVGVLATHRAAGWTLPSAAAVSRRWPLTPLVTVSTSLADGRRRSGPSLPGVEEVPWHDLPGRLTWWLTEWAAGHPGSLGLPSTARREERLADAAARVRRVVESWGVAPAVALTGHSRTSVEGLADLVAAAGFRIARLARGRPRLDEEAEILAWDEFQAGAADLAWLEMLVANRPGLSIVLFESFPRGDSARAGLRAGAAAVLGRPVGLETLAGTLLRVENRRRTALGAAAGDG